MVLLIIGVILQYTVAQPLILSYIPATGIENFPINTDTISFTFDSNVMIGQGYISTRYYDGDLNRWISGQSINVQSNGVRFKFDNMFLNLIFKIGSNCCVYLDRFMNTYLPI